VGRFAHIAPAATLAGAVRIGEGVLVGAGARLLPSVQVGDQAVIGAGAVVLENVPAAQTYIGVPAVSKRKEKSE
jgi:acetyltransferase-like isoleucine patch superfamily enzyme